MSDLIKQLNNYILSFIRDSRSIRDRKITPMFAKLIFIIPECEAAKARDQYYNSASMQVL